MEFAANLITWYQANKRDLPWRNSTNPYVIWLSEIILQQTRVNQGLPYFRAFLEKYPTVNELASAREEEVLRLWQGLGYYSRARNLHKCAREIVENHNGKFPNSFTDLQKLPGIGKYTAAAIASFAFGEQVPVVDGNVYRFISRLFAIRTPINSSRAFNEFFTLLQEYIPASNPSDFNQGIMEFGATVCSPSPNCDHCIFRLECMSRSEGMEREFPVKEKKLKKESVFIRYEVINYQDKVWMKRREEGIWKGLFEFFCAEYSTMKVPNKSFVEENPANYGKNIRYRHQLSHRDLHVEILFKKVEKKPKKLPSEGDFYTLSEIKELPKPILVDKYLKDFLF